MFAGRKAYTQVRVLGYHAMGEILSPSRKVIMSRKVTPKDTDLTYEEAVALTQQLRDAGEKLRTDTRRLEDLEHQMAQDSARIRRNNTQQEREI